MRRIYYTLRPFIPRWLQIAVRRRLVLYKRSVVSDIWPIDQMASKPPDGWSGWPGQKKFSLIMMHDVDTTKGHDNAHHLMEIEKRLGFRSSFNFVPERYNVAPDLRHKLDENGFEVGVHGLIHDGKLFSSKKIFETRAPKINKYLKEWNSVGFSSPSMHRNLEWMKLLNIEYAMSTFDTDPFEPQPEGVSTVFPFTANNSYTELPYTLPQDFTLFILMKEKSIDIWKRKLDWIAEKGGMALLNIHPDYMNFTNKKCELQEYPAEYYEEFLNYVKSTYEDQFWNPLPKEMAGFWSECYSHHIKAERKKIRTCMAAHSFYEYDARVRRYAETLVQRGDQVDG